MMICFGFLSCSTVESTKEMSSISAYGTRTQKEILDDVTSESKHIIPDEETILTYYTYPSCSCYQEVPVDGFAHDFIVYNKQLYLAGFENGIANALQIETNDSSTDVGDFYEATTMSEITIPSWLETSDQLKIQSMTQDFRGKAYVLKNSYKDPNTFQSLSTTHPANQTLQIIELETNQILTEYTIPKANTIQKIRYSKIGNHDVLFVSSPSSPTSIQTFIIKEELISSAVLELDQNILAWDSVIGTIILLTENHSIECHAFIPGFETKSLACFQKCDILPDFPYSLTKPNISMNPVKKSFTIWESVPDGSTWLLSEIMPAPVWINMDATCQAVIAPFAPGLPEKFYFDEENSAIGFEHVAGYKAWIRTPSDFMVLTQYSQDQESYTCWGEMGMITADEEIYKEWMDKYSTKSMMDGRYVKN